MKLRLWLVSLAFILGSHFAQAQHYIGPSESETTDIIDPEFLDGFIGIGGGMTKNLTQNELTQDDIKYRQYAHLEFNRLRRWIALDLRAGFGNSYNDYGLIFKVYKHWRFSSKNSTGLSLGAGVGGMFSPKKNSPTDPRDPYVDLIGVPFARYIWDWGNGVGIEASLEYQLIPLRKYMDTPSTSNSDLRTRFGFGLSLLFEAD
jgi:hypothetical protein